MSLIARDDDGVTWIDGEAYTPLTQREATFLDVTVEAQKKRDDAREQLRGAVASLRVIVTALEGFRDELGGSTRDRIVVALHEAREALDRLGGSRR